MKTLVRKFLHRSMQCLVQSTYRSGVAGGLCSETLDFDIRTPAHGPAVSDAGVDGPDGAQGCQLTGPPSACCQAGRRSKFVGHFFARVRQRPSRGTGKSGDTAAGLDGFGRRSRGKSGDTHSAAATGVGHAFDSEHYVSRGGMRLEITASTGWPGKCSRGSS
jgi:hypothetical protein